VEGPSDGIPQSPGHVVSSKPIAGQSVENTVTYMFTVTAEDADKVCLAGDFNQWRVCEAPMQHLGGDTWSITIQLPRGRHEYMFVIDDQWVTDPDAMGYSDDGFGNRNSVLVV
jgi:1,4-alpha-glucan branching enzyme